MIRRNHNWINENNEEYMVQYECDDIELQDLINEDMEYGCYMHNLNLYEDAYLEDERMQDYIKEECLEDWIEDLRVLRG